MNLNLKLELLVYSDTSNTDPKLRIQDTDIALTDTSITGWSTKQLIVVKNTTDSDISLDRTTANFLFIKSNADIFIKLNSSSTEIEVKKDFPFMIKSSITDLKISNKSTDTDAEILLGTGA